MREGRKIRKDGRAGYIQFKVEPSVRGDVPDGVFGSVNNHFDLTVKGEPNDGRAAAELVSEMWHDAIEQAEHWFDHLMSIVDVDAN